MLCSFKIWIHTGVISFWCQFSLYQRKFIVSYFCVSFLMRHIPHSDKLGIGIVFQLLFRFRKKKSLVWFALTCFCMPLFTNSPWGWLEYYNLSHPSVQEVLHGLRLLWKALARPDQKISAFHVSWYFSVSQEVEGKEAENLYRNPYEYKGCQAHIWWEQTAPKPIFIIGLCNLW